MRENPLFQRVGSFFRRVGAIVLAVLALALLTLLLLLPRTTGQALDTVNGFLRLLILILSDGALLYFIYRQARALAGADHKALLVHSGGSITELTTQSLQDRLQRALQEEVDGVVQNVVQVEPVRGRAKLVLTVSVGRQVTNLPALQREIVKVIQKTVRRELGVALAGQPTIHMSIVDAPASPASKPDSSPNPVIATPAPAADEPKTHDHKGLGIFRRERADRPEHEVPEATTPPTSNRTVLPSIVTPSHETDLEVAPMTPDQPVSIPINEDEDDVETPPDDPTKG